MKFRIFSFSIASAIASLVFSDLAIANQQTVYCTGREATLILQIEKTQLISAWVIGGLNYKTASPAPVLKLADQTEVFEFIVDDSYDTNTYYTLGLLNGVVATRQIYQNGNDADTYEGWLVAEGDSAFVCR